MHQPFKILLPLLLIFTVVSCSDLFNRGDDGPKLRMQTTESPTQTTTFNGDTLVFTPYVPTDSLPPRDYPPFTSTVQGKQVLINGYYLSSGTWQPEASIDKNGDTVTILLQRGDQGSVNFMPTGYFYDAYINNLGSSPITIKIIHQGDMMRGIEDGKHAVFSEKFVIE